jgi:hypothetical protein
MHLDCECLLAIRVAPPRFYRRTFALARLLRSSDVLNTLAFLQCKLEVCADLHRSVDAAMCGRSIKAPKRL